MNYEAITKSLQAQLGRVDLLNYNSNRRKNSVIEFLIVRTQKLKIKMYQEHKHQIPHIHIDYGSEIHSAAYQINPPALIAGHMKREYNASILGWLELNRDSLLKIWDAAHSGGNVQTLVCEVNGNNLPN